MMSRRAVVPLYVVENLDAMKDVREERGLSREEVAVKTGIGAGTLRSYENNRLSAGRPNYNRLATFFGWRLWE